MERRMPIELRHAYRALLRAATYLPDSAARTYIHDHVVYRFRSVTDKFKFASKAGGSCEGLAGRYHDKKRVAKVWQAARQLERAGHGSVSDLKKVLFLTYGRAGKRRRELIQELMLPEESTFPEDETVLEALATEPSKKKPPRYQPTSKLHSFLRSQQANHPADTTKPKIRHLVPQIPEENLWGRPVPLKLQASIKRRHWAATVEKILPPVPAHEWNRLRGLATGAISIEDPPPRRSNRRSSEQSTGEQNDLKLLEYFTTPVRLHDSEVEQIVVDSGQVTTNWSIGVHAESTKGKKTVTPRFMRRFYATIWSLTPAMSQDQVTKVWTTTWGGGRSAALSGQITAPSANDVELFEGADETVKSAPLAQKQALSRRPLQEAALVAPLGQKGYTQGIAVPA